MSNPYTSGEPAILWLNRTMAVDLQPDETGAEPIFEGEAPKTRSALSSLKRELSDEDLAHPGVQKLLLELLARAERDCGELRSFESNFYESDKRNGILEERLRLNFWAEAISMACLAVGAAFLGFLPSVFGEAHGLGWIVGAGGTVLTFIGILAKVIRK